MAQISITRALSEIKKLGETLTQDINGTRFCCITKGAGEKQTVVNSSRKAEVLSAEIAASFQSLTDRIARRSQLKNLVALSNALTMVSIAGQSMTVAQAIEKKASIEFQRNLYNAVRQQYANAVGTVERNNTLLDEQIEKAVQAAYSNDKGTVTVAQYDAVAAPRREANLCAVLDPINSEEWLAKKMVEINDFLTEVDFVLSESNAKTLVEV